jgi:hypothetical protein
VLLDVVSLTRDIGCNNSSGRELNTSSLSLTRVGLLRSNDTDSETHALKSWAVGVGQSRGDSVASALALSDTTENLVQRRGASGRRGKSAGR